MKRRIIVILIILGVLGGMAGGVWWYLRRNAGPKMLARTELAIRAKNYEKALGLAEKYIAEHPDDWQGYHAKARALIRMDRYDDARKAIAEAARLNPDEVSVPITLAESYSHAARRLLAGRGALNKPDVLDEAVGQLEQANKVLLNVKTSDPKRALDLRERAGLNYEKIAFAESAKGGYLAAKANLAEAARDDKEAARWRKQSKDAFAESNRAADDAIRTLLEVAQSDASRPVAVRVLVDLCIQQIEQAKGDLREEIEKEDPKRASKIQEIRERIRQSEKSLAAARKAIDALDIKVRPPVAAVRLALYALEQQTDPSLRSKQLEDLRVLLEELLKEHPDEPEVKLTRAKVAIRLGDPAEAERLCEEILKTDSRHGMARLVLASALMQQGKPAEAEHILFRLKTDFAGWADAHYAYAEAVLATAKKENTDKTQLVRDVMRTVTRLNPSHPGARRYLAESYLKEGSYDLAFADAREYHRAHPDDPMAVRLLAVTAYNTDQPELARKTLEEAEQKHKDNPVMLVAAAEVYKSRRKKQEAGRVFKKAAECKPITAEDRLAVAWAMVQVGRAPEAEKILTDEIRRETKDPRVYFTLGQLYAATRRHLQTIEKLRAAVLIDEHNDAYRLALAQVLFKVGDIEQCRNELAQIDAANAEANPLRLQVKILRGESTEEIVRQVRGAERGGLSLAMVYLNRGRPEKCVEVCLDELKKMPDDRNLHFLLGRAYLAQGRKDKCIEQWKAVLEAAPEWLPMYFQIAGVLAAGLEPRGVQKTLAAIPGARPDMIDMTMGWLFTRLRNFGAAAEAYGRLIGRTGTADFYRRRARLLRARALAADGKTDQAITELNKLSQTQGWKAAAMQAKAGILAAAGRRKEAGALAALLFKAAEEKKDAAALEWTARLYVRLQLVEEALVVCDRVKALFPNDARSYLLRANILAGLGRTGETLPLLRKAIDLQPGNFRIYLKLARSLDAQQRPREALETLKQMEKAGQAGQAEALFEQGSMFARWGLYAQSIECFQRLAAQGEADVPGLRLSLGQAFTALGRKDRARDVLKGIPVYSRQYVAARQLLAGIAETDAEKLKILGELEQVKPDLAGVLVQKMRVLLRADRPAEAVKAFRSFVSRRPKDRPAPARASHLALQAMLAAEDLAAAAEFASQTARDTNSALWRYRAVLLSLDGEVGPAAKMLPDIDKADLHDALLGLVISAQKGDAASGLKWYDRIDQIDRELALMPRPGKIPPSYRLLAALATGRISQAGTALAEFKGAGSLDRHAVAELVGWAGRMKSKAPAEAAKLLKVSVAINVGLASLGRSWATEALKARPECQWAANLVIQTRPDAAALKSLLETVRPRDCLLGRIIQASLLMEEKKYAEAADVFRRAAEAEKNDHYLVLEQAKMTEAAGRLHKALALYRNIWQVTQDPTAANNAAYLVSQLHPRDTAMLREASQWSAAAVKANPRITAFRDTKGWIAFLLSDKEQARLDIRRAIKGLPRSPEAHYHLGVIEADAGNAQLGRWHLAAAVSSAEAIKADGRELTAAEAKSATLAKEALAGMDRKEN